MKDVLLGDIWKVPTAQERIQNKLLSQQYQDEMDRRNELIKQANMLSGPPVMEQPMATPPEGQMTMPVQPQMPINAPSTMPIAQNAPQSTFPPQPMQTPMQNRNALAPQPQIQNYGQLQAHRETQAMLGDQLKIVKALAESNPGAVEAYWNSNPMLKKLGSYNSEMAENGTVQHYISGPDGKPQMVGASFKVPGGKWQFVNMKDIEKPPVGFKNEWEVEGAAAKGDPLAQKILERRKGEKKDLIQDRKTEESGKLDAESAKQIIQQLPKQKTEATLAHNGIMRIDQMLGLLEKGAGGKMGKLRAFVGPYAEAMGYNSQKMTEAQVYETLARTLGGSMRMEMIGPGPVSNYENQLLQKVSGGGNVGIAAARELLIYYKSVGQAKVNDYNSNVDAVSDKTNRFGKIGVQASPQGQKQPIPAERNQNPLNIKRGGATEYLIKEGIATPGSEAKDGGNFLKFNSADEGLEAGKKLLFDSSVYRNLTVDSAMKKWSNGGYDGNIAPQLAMKTVGSLNQQERDTLVKAMIKAEGSGSVGGKSPTSSGKVITRAMAKEELKKRGKVINDKNIALAIEILEGGQ